MVAGGELVWDWEREVEGIEKGRRALGGYWAGDVVGNVNRTKCY